MKHNSCRINLRKRTTIKSAAGAIAASAVAGLDPLLRATAWAQGSDAPEKKEVLYRRHAAPAAA